MKKEYKMAFSEVYAIFKLMPEELLKKIPQGFQNIIEEEREKEYQPNIVEPVEQYKLMDETIIILGLIYRDFLCSDTEKRRLQEKDAKELYEMKKMLNEKLEQEYDVKNIFEKEQKYNFINENNNSNNKENVEKKTEYNEELAMTVEEKKWYKKILNIIRRLFKKN